MITTEDRRLLAEAREAIKGHKDRIRRLDVISRGKASDFWAALKSEIEASIRSNEERINTLLGPDHEAKDSAIEYAEIKACRRAILAYKGVIFSVDQAEDKQRMVENKISELTDRINQIEAGQRPSRRAKEEVV